MIKKDYVKNRSCGMTLGHGLSCQPGYQCGNCALIEELQTELKVAKMFAIELCTGHLKGYDREGYDLWWRVPTMYVPEAAYLLAKEILIGNDEGLVAWKEILEEEPELSE